MSMTQWHMDWTGGGKTMQDIARFVQRRKGDILIFTSIALFPFILFTSLWALHFGGKNAHFSGQVVHLVWRQIEPIFLPVENLTIIMLVYWDNDDGFFAHPKPQPPTQSQDKERRADTLKMAFLTLPHFIKLETMFIKSIVELSIFVI